MLWDMFCRVVDNFGDIGVCWRLARQLVAERGLRLAADLAARGESVRLWVDDSTALAWMAPHGAPGVTVLPWQATDAEPGDVIVEAFGCDLPMRFVQRMAALAATATASAPVWINLEYLSAEAAIERLHGLPSPQLAGSGKGLNKWFFYPGFSAATGGLIRESGLVAAQQGFEAKRWLRGLGIEAREGEQRVSLFCYDNPAVPALLDELAQTPTLLLATAGHAVRQVQHELGPGLTRGRLRAVALPRLAQKDFDALLWACDLNFVRGEDSFVRAQWAGRPFVWQIYPQHDGVHEAKLEAFLGRFLASADAGLGGDVRRLWRRWSGFSGGPVRLADPPVWRRHCEAWRSSLLAQPDLSLQLLRFVYERR